jgi:hypothetical protein
MQVSTGGNPDPDERTQSELRRRLYRFDCPDALTLGEYQIDLLGPAERAAVAAHASECTECGAELQLLRSYLAQPTVLAPSLVERARRVVAALFTPAPGLAYGGLRGTADDATRVFVADDVTVTVGPGSAPGSLIGLVMVAGTPPAALADREVRLVAIDAVVIVSTLDDLGNFEFDLVTAGQYALEIDLPTSLIVVQEVQVR